MTYQPLALKYRPSRFQDMVGQDAVSQALANALALGREPRAILFTGVRGVGKTTVARLYAKALNCKHRLEGSEPCNVCDSCLAIMAGRHEDVLEIDGASNTGVNDVRALQETLEYVPQRSKFKVYIIDEVHMLSQAAFNALLKTLEEPPSHVVFVFATTELEKVPATILSRCQAFYLKKLPIALIRDRLNLVLTKEEIRFEDRALSIIAREGHGSMRDALTLLDQAIALGQGTVTVSGLGPVVSRLSTSPYLDLLHALVRRDAKAALASIALFDQNGAEFAGVFEDTAQLARHGFVIQGLGRDSLDVGLLGLDDAEVQRLIQIVEEAPPFDLNRIFRTLVKGRLDLDGSALDRFVAENYAFEWCLDPGLPDVASLLQGTGGSGQGRPKESPVGEAPKREPLTSRLASSAGSGKASEAAAKPLVVRPESPVPSPLLSPKAQGFGRAEVRIEPLQESKPLPAPADKMSFPPTWRDLLDGWREKKPLSARKLEEAHPIAYGADRIVLGISEQSYASRALLLKEEQMRIRDQFHELFGFAGVLVIEPLAKDAAPAQLPQNVLTERVQEAVDKRRMMIEATRNAPFTQDLVAVLGASIEDIRISDT